MERCHVFFNHFPPVVAFWETVVHHLNQGIDVDAVKIQNIFQVSFCVPRYSHTHISLPLPHSNRSSVLPFYSGVIFFFFFN